jgi:hypothetical protein
VVIGGAHEATGFDKDALNRSIKMWVPTMGPNSDFKHWKGIFLTSSPLRLRTASLSWPSASRAFGWMSRPNTTPTHSCSMHPSKINAPTRQ